MGLIPRRQQLAQTSHRNQIGARGQLGKLRQSTGAEGIEPGLPTSQPFLNPLAFLRGPLGDEEGGSTDTMEVALPLGVLLPSKATVPAMTALFLKLETL